MAQRPRPASRKTTTPMITMKELGAWEGYERPNFAFALKSYLASRYVADPSVPKSYFGPGHDWQWEAAKKLADHFKTEVDGIANSIADAIAKAFPPVNEGERERFWIDGPTLAAMREGARVAAFEKLYGELAEKMLGRVAFR